MIDVHCHLTFQDYDKDRDKVIEDARKTLKAVIISGVKPEDSKKALTLAEKHQNFIYVTLGLHPIYVSELTDREIEEYVKFIKLNKPKIVGIGEVGLDHYWVKKPEEIKRMRKVFINILSLAKELDLPVILHFRQALEEGFKLVTQHDIKKAVFHCFSGKKSLAQEIVNQGYYVSIAPNIFRSKDIKKAVKVIPLEKILVETDSPFLAVKGGRNLPQNVKLVIEKIAETRKTSFLEVEEAIIKNVNKLFGIKV